MPASPAPPAGYTTSPSGLLVPTTLRADAVSDLRSPSAWAQSWARGPRVVSRVPVSPQTSLALATYYACLNIIAQDCAKLPLPVYEELDRGRRKAREHPLWQVLQYRFNDDMTAYVGRWLMTHHAVGWGNGYGLILRHRSLDAGQGEGEVTGIYPIHPARVLPMRDSTGALVYHVYRGTRLLDRAEPTVVPAEDMLHLKGPSSDGLRGWSICEIAAESLGLSLAAQEYGAAFFGNSAQPSGVLEHPGRLGDMAARHLKESWLETHSGPGRSQGVAVLEEGMKFTPIAIPPEQAQFLQTRQFQVPEVARWFRMGLQKLAAMEHLHYNNMEHANLDHVTDTMQPWYVAWEQEIWVKLLHGTDYYVKHDTRALLRADHAARAAYYQALTQIGAYSINEVRELEDFNPIDGGDLHYLQIQYAPLEEIANGTARRARAVPPPLSPDAHTASRNGDGYVPR